MEKKKAKPMAKYQVKSISKGIGVGGRSCSGWSPGPEICEIKVLDDKGEEFFLSLAKSDEFPYFFKTKKSTFKQQVHEIDDKAFWKELNDNNIAGGWSFDEAFEYLDKKEKDLLPLLQFMAGLICPENYFFVTHDINVTTKVVNYDYGDEDGKYKGSYKKLIEKNKVSYDKNRKYRIRGLALQAKYLLEDLAEDFDKLDEKEIQEKIDEIKEYTDKIEAEREIEKKLKTQK